PADDADARQLRAELHRRARHPRRDRPRSRRPVALPARRRDGGPEPARPGAPVDDRYEPRVGLAPAGRARRPDGAAPAPAGLAALAAAELFNFCHVLGLWWTVWFTKVEPPPPAAIGTRDIDVFVTTCGERLDLLERTVRAAVALDGRHRTYVLDDAGRPEVAR